MKQIKVMVFDNFNLAAFDLNGLQMADIQCNLLTAWANKVLEGGLSLDGVVVELQSGARWRLFDTENGFNLERA